MMQELQAYKTYKESGIPWLGRVPAHWEVVLNQRILKEKIRPYNGQPETQLSLSQRDGLIATSEMQERSLQTSSFDNWKVTLPGDLVLNRFKAHLGVFFASNMRGIVSFHYGVFVPLRPMVSKYCELLYHTNIYRTIYAGRSNGMTVGLQNLSNQNFYSVRSIVPPIDEQAAIVRFLGHADRRIRYYIFAKQKLIRLLDEQKQAIINRLVTRGLDPNVHLKPSGVEWLGDVPEHWEISRSRRLFSVRTDLARPDDVQLSATQAYGVIPQSEFESRVGRRVVRISMHLEKRRHVEKDDFVISMRSFQGGLERAWAPGAIRSSYVVLRPDLHVDIDYFAYVFKSRGYIGALQATADFIRDGQDLTFDNFRRVDLPLMPLEEQKAIARFITESVQRVDANRSKLAREIALLHEYRTRLIADVVTGKLDVRDAAAGLPEEVEGPDGLTFDAVEGADDAGLSADEQAEEEVLA